MGQIAGSEIFRGSLWIRPTDPALGQLAYAMSRARERCGGPEFEPHVTVVSGIELPAGEAKRRLERLADGFLPFSVHLSGLDWYSDRYRCFFARVETGPELLSLHRRAQDVFEVRNREAYEPHLSLAYGDVTVDRKRELAGELGGLDVSFQAEALCLVNATREVPVEQWQVRFESRFGGAPAGNLLAAAPVVMT